MERINRNKYLVTAILVTILIFSATIQMLIIPVSPSEYETSQFSSEETLGLIHMRSNESLVPIHMHSNVTLTPVHMHYTGDPTIDPIYEPMFTDWHELYPEYCQNWVLTSLVDNGDGILSACDQIDMTNMDTEEVRWYHVDRVTWTMFLTNEFMEEMFIEFKGPPGADPIYFPWDTLWHEVWPFYCNIYWIVDWRDNGNEILDFCDYIILDDGMGGIMEWHVEDVATDIILREKIADPRCTWWHELYPDYCEWSHITSWEDNQIEGEPGYGMLSPYDQIDMCDYINETERWDIFWSMGDVNRDGYINMTDIEIIAKNFGWEGPPGENPADINSDGKVNMLDANRCAYNQHFNFWAYFYKWYHVDRVTLTLNVTKEFEDEPILIEFKGGFEEMYRAFSWPVDTKWYEVYPNYCNSYTLTWWDWFEDDNCNGVLDVCDYIWLLNESSGIEERYHVDDICYDIILNKKIMDPRGAGWQLHTRWHELYPDYCQKWRLTGWEDTGEPFGQLSPCDQIDMNNTETKERRRYHVYRVTLTLKVYNPDLGEMYIEFKGPFEDIYLAKIKPVCTLWHQVWPYYSETYHITNWTDNCNGVLDYCDYIQFDLTGDVWWHVEDLAIGIILTEKWCMPKFDAINYRVVSDMQTAVNEMKAGKIDYIRNVTDVAMQEDLEARGFNLSVSGLEVSAYGRGGLGGVCTRYLEGWVHMETYGSDNGYTWCNMHWKDNPTGECENIVRRQAQAPSGFNPWYSDSVYEWEYMHRIYESLLDVNGETLEDEPYIACDWNITYGSWPELGIENGMTITFWLKDDVYWQDGYKVTAEDVKANWDYLKKYQVPQYSTMWENMVYCETVGPYKVAAYIDAEDGSLLYDYARTALFYSKWTLVGFDKLVDDPADPWGVSHPSDFEGWKVDYQDFADYCEVEYGPWVNPDTGIPITIPQTKWDPSVGGELKCLIGTGNYYYYYYNETSEDGTMLKNTAWWVRCRNSELFCGIDAVSEPNKPQGTEPYWTILYRQDDCTTARFEIVVRNLGVQTIECNVSVSLDGEIFDWAVTTVEPYSHATVEFETPVVPGYEHELGQMVTCEDALAPACEGDKNVWWTIREDINLDCKVRVDDVLTAAVAFGSSVVPYHIRWDPSADVNHDFKVRVDDILAIALKFGYTAPTLCP